VRGPARLTKTEKVSGDLCDEKAVKMKGGEIFRENNKDRLAQHARGIVFPSHATIEPTTDDGSKYPKLGVLSCFFWDENARADQGAAATASWQKVLEID
jgi:hypothetical protein